MIMAPQRPPYTGPAPLAPTTQDIAIVVCGGGDPVAEYTDAIALCTRAGRRFVTFVGNDQIGLFPLPYDHAVTLHPDKLSKWKTERRDLGLPDPTHIWAHRPFTGVTDWTKDWQGSTGLLCVKIARELGHTHVILCGVHLSVETDHFRRKQPWKAAISFRRGWIAHLRELQPYVRSYGGWTHSMFGAPSENWVGTDIEDGNPYPSPRVGERA